VYGDYPARANSSLAADSISKNLQYQQNLADRRMDILVLTKTDWRTIDAHTAHVLTANDALRPGLSLELQYPPHSEETLQS